MKFLFLLIFMTLSLMAEVDLNPYKKAKHTVVKTLAANKQVYKLSQDLAIEKHKEALILWAAVAENDAKFKMIYDEWKVLKNKKSAQDLKRFYLVDNEIEYYMLSTIKNDYRYRAEYDSWAEAQSNLNAFRLKQIRKTDREVLNDAYELMAKFRNNKALNI